MGPKPVLDFPHPSRPGYYGIVVSDSQREAIAALVDALIPGDAHYPCASDAQVPDFLCARMGSDDLKLLNEVVADTKQPLTADEAERVIARLQEDRPVVFAWLRELTYHGYYASPRVLAAMTDRGYGYHGAPQPLGYSIAEEMLKPQSRRGVYLPTEAVTRVAL